MFIIYCILLYIKNHSLIQLKLELKPIVIQTMIPLAHLIFYHLIRNILLWN